MQQKPHQKATSRDWVLYRLIAKSLINNRPQDVEQEQVSGITTDTSSPNQQQSSGSSSSRPTHDISPRNAESIHPLEYRAIGLLQSHIEQREPYLGEEKIYSKQGEFILEVFKELSLPLRELEILYVKVCIST